MHEVERDNVRQDTMDRDKVNQQEVLAAEHLPEPLPVDESGLEHSDDTVRDRDITPDATSVDAAPVDAAPITQPGAVPGQRSDHHDTEVFTGDDVTRLRARWREAQADFVDDPRRAVQQADEVVDEVMKTITEHRQRLASDWKGNTDTEDLRLAMQEYRSFFDRLIPTT